MGQVSRYAQKWNGLRHMTAGRSTGRNSFATDLLRDPYEMTGLAHDDTEAGYATLG